MKFQLLILLLFFSFLTKGQVIINGIIQDTLGNPIRGAIIQQIEAQNNPSIDSIDAARNNYIRRSYFSESDWDGIFHLKMDTTVDLDLRITLYNMKDTILLVESVPKKLLVITLYEDTFPQYKTNYSRHHNYNRNPSELTMGLDFFQKNYDEFIPLLGADNIGHLNRLPLSLTFELAKNFGRLFTGVTFGFSYNSRRLGDTLNIEANQSLYSFQLGYKIIDSKKFILQPQISAKLYRTRLINGLIGDKVPLPNYLNDQDIDLRFLQPIVDFGLTLGYKIIPKYAAKNNYFIIGLHGGYPIKMTDRPRINGLRTKLKTDQSIAIGDFTIGLFWRVHFQE